MFYVYVVLSVLFYFLFKKWSSFNEYAKKINKIPGPPTYPLLGNSLEFLKSSRIDIQECFLQWHKQYDGLYRVWLGLEPMIRLEKAEYIEDLVKSPKHIEKASNYDFLKTWLGEGLLTTNGQRWFQHRRLITPGFHFTILENFVTIFGENSNIFVDNLDALSKNGKSVLVFPMIKKCTLDIICETAMGVKINAQKVTANSEYVEAVNGISKIFFHRFVKPWYRDDKVFKLSSLGRQSTKILSVLHSFTERVITERKQSKLSKTQGTDNDDDTFGKKKRMAFLDLLLETDFSDQDIREEVDTFMFEGHDTTSAGIFWTMAILGTHTDIQEKVYEELESIFGSDKTRIPEISDLNDMKYLERVLKESMRMYPPVANFGRKLNEDLKIGNYIIPKSTTVGVGIFFIHRNEKYFPNPDKFDPDRFLPENSDKRHPYTYIPFSAGPRNCIGQKFAMYEEKTVISSIVRNFKFKCHSDHSTIKKITELVLRPVDDVYFDFERRK